MEKQAILDKHNDIRRQSAFELLASNMRKLVWDNELEAVAQRLAEQCNDDSHDTNRKKLDGTEVGQNKFGLVTASFPSGIQHVQKAVQSWYSDFNTPGFPGHYTQLLWAETDQLGCGKVVFKQEAGYKMQIICNYAVAADLKDPGSMYKSGEACSTCPDTCDDGLCSKGRQTQDCQNF